MHIILLNKVDGKIVVMFIIQKGVNFLFDIKGPYSFFSGSISNSIKMTIKHMNRVFMKLNVNSL